MKSLKQISLYCLSGVMLGIGFVFPAYWLMGIVGAALHIKILSHYKSGQILGSYFAWFIKFLFVLGFYWTIYPIRWLPMDFGSGELFLVGLYWVTVSLFVATSGLVFGVLFKIVHGVLEHTKWLWYALIPFVWVLAEISGSFLLSVFTYGPGSLFNGYFSLGYIGLLLGENALLLYLAKFGGVYLLSFVAVVIAVWFSRIQISRPQKRLYILPVTAAVLLYVSSFIPFSSIGYNSDRTVSSTQVAVISTEFPIEEAFQREGFEDLVKEQEDALGTAVNTGAKYIVTPEDERFMNQLDIEQAKSYFSFKNQSVETVIIDSSRVPHGESRVLQGIIFDTQTNDHVEVHKKYLVPQGEFVPHFYEWLFSLLGFEYIIDELKGLLSYTIGPNTSQVNLPDHYPGVLFCFESSAATGVRNLIKERPDLPFVAHPVSHVWFNAPESLWSQLETSLQVQAVWNDVSIVSAGKHAPSQLFLPDGSIEEPEIIHEAEFWSVGIFEVPLRNI